MNRLVEIYDMTADGIDELKTLIEQSIKDYNHRLGKIAYSQRQAPSGFFPVLYINAKNSQQMYIYWRFHLMDGFKSQKLSEYIRANKTGEPYTLNSFTRHRSKFISKNGKRVQPKIATWEAPLIADFEFTLQGYRRELKTLQQVQKITRAYLCS